MTCIHNGKKSRLVIVVKNMVSCNKTHREKVE